VREFERRLTMFESQLKLRNFSTDQLIEELARRANARGTRKPKLWCHDCANFVAWCDRKPGPRKSVKPIEDGCPEDYNPCTKGHEMKFVVPEMIDDEYGLYLPVCADRKPISGIVE
jgi:hypothetical protein